MCGLSGLVCLDPGRCRQNHMSIVSVISDTLVHRGPDDRGIETLGRAALASNRLSIIDLSAAGHMPMHNPTTGRWIAFNGEVYNFADLRAELSAAGHEFHSSTDTEVVLHAWEEWGEQALERFVGMFAFAIYDPSLEKISHNKLSDDSDFSGSPAISNGQLFLRSDTFLYCIGS